MTDDATNLGGGEAMPADPGVAEASSDGSILELAPENLNDELANDLGVSPGFDAGESGGEHTDIVEIEHDGETHHIPKALERAFLFQADYTRKTQELAHQRRALEAQALDFHHASTTMSQGQVDLALIDRQLDAYEAMDWRGLYAEDPAFTEQEHAAYEDLHALRAAVVDQLVGAEQHVALESERATAIRVQHGLDMLAREIPDWGPELAGRLMAYGAEAYGFSQAELGDNQDPRLVKLLHDAFSGAQAAYAQRLRAGQSTAPAATLRGGGGRFVTAADTSDFAAFERMADGALSGR